MYEILKSTVNGETNSISVITTFDRSLNNNVILGDENNWMDNSLQKLFFEEYSSNYDETGRVWTYSISDDSWSVGTLTNESTQAGIDYQPIN